MQSTEQTTLTDAVDARGERGPALEVETETVAVVDDPERDPFERVEDGSLTLPSHEAWECSGVVHQPDANTHSVTYSGSHAVPGYPWSEKAMVVVETNDSDGGPYLLRLLPFDADGEFRGFPQPSLTVNEYDRLRDALVNVEHALGVLADREPGDPVAIDGLKNRR